MYVFPRIGDKPVSDVSSADLLEVLAPLFVGSGICKSLQILRASSSLMSP